MAGGRGRRCESIFWQAAERERESMSCASGKQTCLQLTILKDTLHIQAVGGAGLVVGATLQVAGQFAGARVVDDARIAFADGV